MSETDNAATSTTLPGPPESAILVNRCEVRLWNLSQEERLRRALARCGIWNVRTESDPPLPAATPIVLLRTDFALDESLIKALVRGSECLLVAATGNGRRMAVAAQVLPGDLQQVLELMRQPPDAADRTATVDLPVVEPEGLGSSYNHDLRKRAPPLVLSLTENAPIAVERAMFRASYKGVTDFVTKWLWPWPGFWVTRWCAAHKISPNLVTVASLLLVLLAIWLFARQHFALGLIAAWLMTFLDTVDGKLARVTLTSSRLGNVLDHGIDLVHPPFWYIAWYFGVAAEATPTQSLLLAGAVWTSVIGYVVGRLQEGFFLWRYGVELHAWRPIDSAFRLFTARRNPNLVLLTIAVIAGRPDLGLHAVAAWTALSLLFHFLRIGQAIQRERKGESLRSWLAEEPSGSA